jgi:hypothetical protein
MTVVERIREKRQAKEVTNHAAYADLLRSLASGEVVDDIETELVLQMVGKSLRDLETDVDIMKRRLSWSSMLAGESALRQKLRQLEAEHLQAVHDLREAQQRLGAIVEAKRLSVRAVADQLDSVPTALSGLLSTCMDASVLDRERRNMVAIKSLRNEIDEAEYSLRSRQADLNMVLRSQMVGKPYQRTSLVYQPPEPTSEDAKREAFLRDDIESREQELAPMRQRMAQLMQEQAEIHQLKLVP